MSVVIENKELPVKAAREGCSDAWNVLFKRYQLPIYVYLFELVHDEQLSLDIVQETFIAAVRYLPSLREDARFGSWLFSIAHQKCIQKWRRRSHEEIQPDTDLADLPDGKEGPDDFLIRREQEETFMTLLSLLSLPQRSVLLLHFVEDFPLTEIALITGVSVGTVKSRLHYAKKALLRFESVG